MRFDYQFAVKEYKKVKTYIEKHGYRCEITGSLRRKKKDVGDIDIVVGNQLSLSDSRSLSKREEVKLEKKECLKELETEVLEIISKYNQVKRRINYYEFLLESGISIHMIPEISKHFNYTLWHSTGPKPHVKLIKKMYDKKDIKISMENIIENQIYEDIDLEYFQPKDRWELV